MQAYTYLFFLRKIGFHVLETRIHVIYVFSLPKVKFMHPVSLLRVPEKLAALLAISRSFPPVLSQTHSNQTPTPTPISSCQNL